MTFELNLPPGKKVRNLRMAKGITQMTLAYDVGWSSPGSISKLESGFDRFTKAHAITFAKYFKVDESIFEVGALATK